MTSTTISWIITHKRPFKILALPLLLLLKKFFGANKEVYFWISQRKIQHKTTVPDQAAAVITT